ncbi:MAG: chromate transporter [Anaerovoracaceae bacterium]|jgi:chromate transporter
MIYLKIFLVFAKIGLFGFGGGVAMLPMIYQGAEQFGLMSAGEFSNLVAISQVTPGPLAVNAATYVGYNCAGIPGAAIATFGEALPSFILVTLACYFIEQFKGNPLITGAFLGIRPVTVGLIASAALMIGQTTFTSLAPVPIIICGVTIIVSMMKKLGPIQIMIISGIAGAIFCS